MTAEQIQEELRVIAERVMEQPGIESAYEFQGYFNSYATAWALKHLPAADAAELINSFPDPKSHL
jgi:hypothetical protein